MAYASNIINANHDPKVLYAVSKQSGHCNTRVTEQFYLSEAEGVDTAAHAEIEDVLAKQKAEAQKKKGTL